MQCITVHSLIILYALPLAMWYKQNYFEPGSTIVDSILAIKTQEDGVVCPSIVHLYNLRQQLHVKGSCQHTVHKTCFWAVVYMTSHIYLCWMENEQKLSASTYFKLWRKALLEEMASVVPGRSVMIHMYKYNIISVWFTIALTSSWCWGA